MNRWRSTTTDAHLKFQWKMAAFLLLLSFCCYFLRSFCFCYCLKSSLFYHMLRNIWPCDDVMYTGRYVWTRAWLACWETRQQARDGSSKVTARHVSLHQNNLIYLSIYLSIYLYCSWISFILFCCMLIVHHPYGQLNWKWYISILILLFHIGHLLYKSTRDTLFKYIQLILQWNLLSP